MPIVASPKESAPAAGCYNVEHNNIARTKKIPQRYFHYLHTDVYDNPSSTEKEKKNAEKSY